MKWTKFPRKDAKTLIDKKQLDDRAIDRNKVVLEASGSPMTAWFRNRSGQHCYCHPNNKTAPDSRHELCFGTGYLNAYQKYGYTTNTWAASHTGLTLTNIRKGSSGRTGRTSTARNNILMLQGGLTGTIVTDQIPLTSFIRHTFFTTSENVVSGESAVTYEYSFNGSTWTTVPGNVAAIGASSTGYIQFKATLTRTNTNVKLPSVEYMRYRFQTKQALATLDSRFPRATIPAFLASRSKPKREIRQTPAGWEVYFPTNYWTIGIPIEEGTVGMFIYGTFANLRFEAYNVGIYTHGDAQKVWHRDWDTRFIRDDDDVLGILYSLS